EIEASRGLHRNADARRAAVDLHLAEELVLVRDALRQLGRAQAGALGGETKALAVQVVAVGDGEIDLDRARHRARAEAERLLRLEQLVGFPEKLRRRRRPDGEKSAEKENPFHVLVSAATQ